MNVLGVTNVCGHLCYNEGPCRLLSIIATILERNPEIAFTQSRIDCDSLIKKGFALFAAEEGIEDLNDLTPFYQLEGQALSTSTATFLTKAVVEFILVGRHFSQVINIFGEGTTEDKTLPNQHHRGKMPKVLYTGRSSSENKKRHIHHHHQHSPSGGFLQPPPTAGTTSSLMLPSGVVVAPPTASSTSHDESCRMQ
uniref:Phosphorylase b kinase regulatory subunit n=1 Tax=Caenorhabditis japonica TaxID=281687 RepID=A0A8R1IRR1_CAEJA